MQTTKAGFLKLRNDFPTKYISDIRIFERGQGMQDPVEIYRNRSSYRPGSEIDLGAYSGSSDLMVRFKAADPQQPASEYFYSLNGSHFVNAVFKNETVLNAINDFVKVDQ